MAVFDARPSAFTQLTTTGEWENLWNATIGVNGIDGLAGSAMTPSLDSPGRNAVIADGIAVLKGQLWRCDASVSTAIPAASAQNRIDRLVLRLTRGATTAPTVVQPFIITGTPSGSPVKPPIVQTTTGIWDFPISSWTSTSAGAITSLVDERALLNDPWHSLGTLAQFTVTFGRYRLIPESNSLELDIEVTTSAATNAPSTTFSTTLPLAYQPQTNHRRVLGIAGTSSLGTVEPNVVVNTAGGVIVGLNTNVGSGTVIYGSATVPLD
jgi:hypothetical protein